MATVTDLMVVPQGYRIGQALIDGQPTSVFVPKTHRKGYKTPKAVRDKISASLKKFQVPVLSAGAQLPWALPAGFKLYDAIKDPNMNNKKRYFVQSASELTKAFTGINMDWTVSGGLKTGFNLFDMKNGLVPNGIVYIINKSKVLAPLNRGLARTKLPFRLK